MQAQTVKEDLYVKLGDFLEYPRQGLAESPQQIGFADDIASRYLDDFFIAMGKMSLAERQEHYVRTFDLMPACCLYVSVHLFGEESFKRAELMAGLKKVYEKHHAADMTELPDHLAVLLKQNLLFDKEEWLELVSFCLLPALSKMIKILDKGPNPYVFVLKAVQELLAQKEMVHV